MGVEEVSPKEKSIDVVLLYVRIVKVHSKYAFLYL